jgi:hypothetical protein
MLEFKSFVATQDSLVGVELMHMLKERQIVVEGGDENLTAAEQFYALASSSPHRQDRLASHRLEIDRLRSSSGLSHVSLSSP